MPDYIQVILLTTLAGAAMPVGGAIARIERIHPQWLEQEFRHSVIAFGGGILVSAVALVLVPEGIKGISIPLSTAAMVLGGAAFAELDWGLSKTQASAAQLVAMLSDFLPEALALGATFATGHGVGFLLAVLIAAQNLPEGFQCLPGIARLRTAQPERRTARLRRAGPAWPRRGPCRSLLALRVSDRR